MQYATLILEDYGNYRFTFISNEDMGILGFFLTDDVGCPVPSYNEWILDDSLGMYVSGNITALEKDGDYILLEDMYDQRKNPTRLKISRKSLITLLHDWQEKVCKLKPKNVTIKHENDIFTIETE